MKRFIVGAFVLLLVAVICGGLIWFNFFRDKMIGQFFAHFPIPTVTISTVDVEPQTWNPGIEAIGTVFAAQGVNVANQSAGVIEAINFKANDKVEAGQLLVQIDDTIDRATLESAKSTVAVNQDSLTRTQALYDRKFSTPADLQSAQNKLSLAQGALGQIQANISLKAIRAPFAGTMGIPRVDVGAYVTAGTTLATLQELDKMRVDFTVPEQELPNLKIGQAISLGLTEDQLNFNGAITGIDPKVDPISRLVSLRAIVDNSNDTLTPGQFVRVRVHLPEEPNVIALPQTAVVLSLYGSFVYQVVEAPPPDNGTASQGGQAPAAPAAPATPPAANGQAPATPPAPQLIAKQVFVQTGRRSDTQIEVTKGVDPGMQIVSSGQNKLSNGSHIAVDNSVNPANGASAPAGATADAAK